MSDSDDDVLPEWLTKAQFARAAGCDEKQVRRGLRSGSLVMRPDGRLHHSQLEAGWRRPRVDSREAPQVPDIRTVRQRRKSGHRANVRTSAPAENRSEPRRKIDAEALLKQLAVRRVPETLPMREVRAILQALDGQIPVLWAEPLQVDRACRGAQAVLWEAARSSARDDGHWGGFQLRARPGCEQRPVIEDDVVAGWGFDLLPLEVLRECRGWVADLVDDHGEAFRALDEFVQVIPALLPALAFPHFPEQRWGAHAPDIEVEEALQVEDASSTA